jgi:hypothetical protein
MVSSYFRRAFNINNLLEPYFSDQSKPDLIDQFRLMQARTGTIISGSSALQFFARTSYPDSDLDLYTALHGAAEVADFITKADYTYVPREHQELEWMAELREAARRTREETSPSEYDWDGGMATLLDFTKGAEKIQLIVARESAVERVLKFHSSSFPTSSLNPI